MTLDRALELAEALLHKEIQHSERLGLVGGDYVKALVEIGKLRTITKANTTLSRALIRLFR